MVYACTCTCTCTVTPAPARRFVRSVGTQSIMRHQAWPFLSLVLAWHIIFHYNGWMDAGQLGPARLVYLSNSPKIIGMGMESMCRQLQPDLPHSIHAVRRSASVDVYTVDVGTGAVACI